MYIISCDVSVSSSISIISCNVIDSLIDWLILFDISTLYAVTDYNCTNKNIYMINHKLQRNNAHNSNEKV